MAVNDDLADDAIMRSVRAMRAGNGIWKELLPILKRAERTLIEKLESGAPRTLASRRADALLREIRRTIDAGAEEFQKRLEEGGLKLAQAEESAAAGSLASRVPVDVEWVRPSTTLLEAVAVSRPFGGALLKDHLGKWSADTVFAMQAEIREAIVIGEGIEPMQRRLRRVADIKIADARTLARTYTSHVVNEARTVLYAENADVIAKEQWVATLDTRTCLRCAALDNKIYPVGKGPRPPLHMNCRCVRSPITRGAEYLYERGLIAKPTRAAEGEMNGDAPADMAFPAWLSRQSESRQREVLGPERFKLFKKGVKIDRFVNDENDIIPLSELNLGP